MLSACTDRAALASSCFQSTRLQSSRVTYVIMERTQKVDSERADQLRRRISLYRRRLQECITEEQTFLYLREITETEAELANYIEDNDDET